jgi:hypothetical protein
MGRAVLRSYSCGTTQLGRAALARFLEGGLGIAVGLAVILLLFAASCENRIVGDAMRWIKSELADNNPSQPKTRGTAGATLGVAYRQ